MIENLECRAMLAVANFQLDASLFTGTNPDTSFGWNAASASIATQGSKTLVGLPGEASGAGVAYLIDRSASPTTVTPIANPDVSTYQDAFGRSVAFLADGSLLIGAPGDNAEAGAAWIFNASGGSGQKIENPDPMQNIGFGEKVYGYGNTPLINTLRTLLDEYGDLVEQRGVLLAPDGSGGFLSLDSGQPVYSTDDFGFSAAVGPNGELLVGARNANAVYLFDSLTDAQPQVIDADGIGLSGYSWDLGFGTAVAFTSGGNLLVGAPNSIYGGAVYVIDPASPTSATAINPPGSSDSFGYSIATTGDQLLVGAPGLDKTLVYDLANLSTTPGSISTPAAATAIFATALAFSGSDFVAVADGSTGSGGVFFYVPAPPPAPPTATAWLATNGVLQVQLHAGNNVATLTSVTGGVELTVNNQAVGTYSPYTGIAIQGNTGDDTVTIDAAITLPATITGGDGNDSITSALGNDWIDGGAGNDTINAHSGLDTILGSDGHDSLDGAAGSDSIVGGLGNDTMNGSTGHDTLKGNDGEDVLDGRHGDDHLDGGAGSDILWGFVGNDTLIGYNGHDLMYGEDGNDSLDGGNGEDSLYGGNDDDTVIGGNASDLLDGGAGNDWVYADGDGFADAVYGGTGTDRGLLDLSGPVLDKYTGIEVFL